MWALTASGNDLCNGSQQLNAITPPSCLGYTKAEYKARAPPCEKPPKMILLGGMPSLISSSIILWMVAVAFLMPSSSSGLFASKLFKSNQDGILNPALSDTGIVGLEKKIIS